METIAINEEEPAEEPEDVPADESSDEADAGLSEETEVPEETFIISPQYEDGSSEKSIQDYAANVVREYYEDTDIESISINKNLGTDEPDDYIVLARFIWTQTNTASTTKEMISMYSSDFAARIGMDQLSVNEVAIFWTVPYLDNANAKWSYERSGDGMYLSDSFDGLTYNR